MTSEQSTFGISVLVVVAIFAMWLRDAYRRRDEDDYDEEHNPIPAMIAESWKESRMKGEIDTDEFARDLAKIAAKQLIKRLAWDGRVTTNDLYRLQDATSLFSPYTHEAIMQELRNAGAKIVDTTFELPPGEKK